MSALFNEVLGRSGTRYFFKQMIQERLHVGRVWMAMFDGLDNKNFLLKQMPEAIYSGFVTDIWPRLPSSRFVRAPFDCIPEQQVLVYPYLDDDFLDLVKHQIPMVTRKHILKSALTGLADLHGRDIVHLDIKPDNILVDYHHTDQGVHADHVQLIDLENAAYLPKGRCIKGMLAGNENWRSPEAHFKGELNKPSDIFSFAAICIYAVLGRVIFGADGDLRYHEANGVLPHLIRLQRQVSIFGDLDGFNGLMKHIGDQDINCQVLQMLWEDRGADEIPYRCFSDWPDLDDEFKDLIAKMTNLDPTRRVTARQALEHSWFVDVKDD